MAEEETSPSVPSESPQNPGAQAGRAPSADVEPPRQVSRARRKRVAVSPGIFLFGGVKLGFQNFSTFFLLAFFCQAPLFVTQIWAAESLFARKIAALTGKGPLDEVTLIVPSAGNLFLQGILGFLTTAVLVFTAVQTLSGRRPSFGEAFSQGFSRLLPLLWVSFLSSLFVGIGFLLFLVPGFILLFMLYLAPTVTVMEGKGGMQALKRSARLTNGYKLDLFLGLLPLGVVSGIWTGVWQWGGVSLITSVIGRPQSLEGWKFVVGAHAFFSTLWPVVYSLFTATFASFAYVKLKELKEGVSIRELVEVFR